MHDLTPGEQPKQESPRRVLVLFAHPSLDRSEVNRPLADATKARTNVTFIDLYAEYPRLDIDVDCEQQRLRNHDVIVFMHPLYWYSTPAILKEWQDLVLEYGFAYGSEGTALHGKIFFNAITTGGSVEAYSNKGYQHFPLRELLRPFEQTASLCGMTYLPPFTLFSARSAYEEKRIDAHIEDWLTLIEALQLRRLNIDQAKQQTILNADIDMLLGKERL